MDPSELSLTLSTHLQHTKMIEGLNKTNSQVWLVIKALHLFTIADFQQGQVSPWRHT